MMVTMIMVILCARRFFRAPSDDDDDDDDDDSANSCWCRQQTVGSQEGSALLFSDSALLPFRQSACRQPSECFSLSASIGEGRFICCKCVLFCVHELDWRLYSPSSVT